MELRSFPGLFQFTNSICLGNVGGQGQKKGAEFHFDFWIETTEAVNTAFSRKGVPGFGEYVRVKSGTTLGMWVERSRMDLMRCA